jgi:hypothetical protein
MRRVLFKQRDNNFFPPTAYALALLLVRIPFQLLEAALYCGIIYFWVGARAPLGYCRVFRGFGLHPACTRGISMLPSTPLHVSPSPLTLCLALTG